MTLRLVDVWPITGTELPPWRLRASQGSGWSWQASVDGRCVRVGVLVCRGVAILFTTIYLLYTINHHPSFRLLCGWYQGALLILSHRQRVAISSVLKMKVDMKLLRLQWLTTPMILIFILIDYCLVIKCLIHTFVSLIYVVCKFLINKKNYCLTDTRTLLFRSVTV